MSGAASMRERALAAAQAGRSDEAERLFHEAAARHPRDAALLNSVGSFHAGRQTWEVALDWFDRALSVSTGHVEASINRAVMLTRLHRPREAAADLKLKESTLRHHPRYWTARAAAERAAGDHAAAQSSYDVALRADPCNARALQGRAQVALERGADDAVAWHERALSAVPGDRFVVRGLAQAYEAAGRLPDALALTRSLAAQAPGWTEGLKLHAAIRWSAGERDGFCDHFGSAGERAPSPQLYHAWALTLAGVDRHAEAADIAAAGLRRWPGTRALAVVEAMAAGSAGDLARADRILAAHDDESVDWRIIRARQLIRRRDAQKASALLEGVVAQRQDDITAWSLLDIAWRLADDDRHHWLSKQAGLIQEVSLDLSPSAFYGAIALLHRLHDRASMPVGQSVKQGSQTRGGLFARGEPEVAAIHMAVDGALARYRDALPARDPVHPLLRHRDAPWRIAGSWSIRLKDSGRHASHVHPAGIVSSAAYFLVPETGDFGDTAGWLELGRPPSDLNTDLPAIATVRPRPGCAVLFPSTLFHGTRPLTGGARMTVAFDVSAE